MFLSRNKKNNVYPCKPQFYYIKMGFKGVNIIEACFCDGISVTFLCFLHSVFVTVLVCDVFSCHFNFIQCHWRLLSVTMAFPRYCHIYIVVQGEKSIKIRLIKPRTLGSQSEHTTTKLTGPDH